MRKKEPVNANKPPPALSELIEMMRYVPADYLLPAADEVLENVFLENNGSAATADFILQSAFNESERLNYEYVPGNELIGSFSAVSDALEAIRQMLQTDCPLLVENILPKSGSFEETFWTWSRYQDYVQLRREFLMVLSRLEEFRPYNFDKEKIPFYTASHLPAVSTTFDFDENRRITFQSNFLIGALEGADPNRLRQCNVCRRVFWAFRLNTKFCEKKCADIYFQQQRRLDEEKNKSINKRRRENYKRNKNLKSLKGNVNGTL